MNSTNIEWTPELIAAQRKRNEEREKTGYKAPTKELIAEQEKSRQRTARKSVRKKPIKKPTKKAKPKKRGYVQYARTKPRAPQAVPLPYSAMITRYAPRRLPHTLSEVVKEPGFVYLIECRGLYKIGMTVNVPRRLRELEKKWNMDAYTIVHVITSDDMIYLEAALHKRFTDKCVHSEWFSLSADDVSWIVGLGDTVNGLNVLLLAI